MSSPTVIKQPPNVVDLQQKRQETREQVLERLFNEHRTALRAFLIGRTGLEQDVDDVIQEVFIRLSRLENLQERLPPGGRINIAYIFSVAHNLVIDMERSRAMQRSRLEQHRLEQTDTSREAPAPEAIVLAGQELERVKSVILTMRPNWRRAFILNRFQFKTYREIAEVMGVSVKQVEKYMKSALIKIRDATEDSVVMPGDQGGNDRE